MLPAESREFVFSFWQFLPAEEKCAAPQLANAVHLLRDSAAPF